jgi:LPS export ABC transporter protein LptC
MMVFVRNKNPKKLKIFLLSVILITFGIILSVFISHRRSFNNHEKPVSSIQNEANLSIDNVHHIATRNGIKEWTLDAASAYYINAKKQAILQDLSVTFFLKNKKKVYLTANQGILKTDTNDIEVTGSVVLKNEHYRLKTEHLHYKHNKCIIFSKAPVKITCDTLNLSANAIFYDLNTNKTVLDGKVEGTFSENISF